MDRIRALGNILPQITLYDVKSTYNQAENVVPNVSEMEAKVQEATRNEPRGASLTLMQEIAQGTFNYEQFTKIMPAIHSRFTETEAREWRQIYKALELLEYLIKNGSEIAVDDAHSYISTVKMLKNFHYIDDEGKDQGINVRTRSHEIFELLLDIEKIRAERRKAKANNSKYISATNRGWSFSGWGSSVIGDTGWGSSGSGGGGWGSFGSGGGGWGSFGSGGGGWGSTSSGNGGRCSSADVTVGWGSTSNSNGGWGSTSGGTCYEGLTSDNIGSWGGGSYGGYHGGYSESN